MLTAYATIAICVPELSKNKKPRLDRVAVVRVKFQLVAAVESNHQTQNEDEQIDVSQVHRQSSGQILVVAVAAG